MTSAHSLLHATDSSADLQRLSKLDVLSSSIRVKLSLSAAASRACAGAMTTIALKPALGSSGSQAKAVLVSGQAGFGSSVL